MQHSFTSWARRPFGFFVAALLGVGLVATGTTLANYAAPVNGTAPLQPSVVQGNGEDDPEEFEAKGIIEASPVADTGQMFGTWTIGGQDYEAQQEETSFRDGVELLTIGACAEVKYILDSDQVTRLATRIKSTDDCPGGGDNGGGGDNNGDDDNDYEGYNDRYSDEFKGVVLSFPSNLIGEWVVSSTLGSSPYTATAFTRFQQKEGPFRVGACVEIKTDGRGASTLKSIKTDEHCPGNGGGASNQARLTGVLYALPDDPDLIGSWQISYTISATTSISQVVVTGDTEQDDGHGPFYVGACVRARYDRDTLIASKVESESYEDCGSRSPIIAGGVITLSDGLTVEMQSDAVISVTYGFVTSSPTDTLFGSWTISDTAYDAVRGVTGFELEHGSIDVGDCAKVRYFVGQPADERVATRIESDEPYKCTRTRTETSEIHGIVTLMPGSIYGPWQIGDLFYDVVSGTTTIIGTPAEGSIVEVKFTVEADGTLLARRIKVEEIYEEDREGGKTTGIVEVRPLSPTKAGAWTIAGADYTGTVDTRVRGPVDVGTCVDAYFSIALDGGRTLRKVKAESPGDCATDPDTGLPVQTTYGFVDDLPVGSYIGTWLVSGAAYEADATTTFEADGGTFVAGTFVEVRYIVTDSVRIALYIEAHVPPNAGDVSEFVELEIDDSGNMSVTNELSQTSPIEVIGATMVDESLGDLEDGIVVYVNTYTDTVTTTLAARGAVASAGSEVRVVTKLIARPDLTLAAVPALTPTPDVPLVTTTPSPAPATPTVDPSLPTPTPMPTPTAAATSVPGPVKVYVPISIR